MRDAVRCVCRGVLIASESSPLTFMDYFMDYTYYTICPQTLGKWDELHISLILYASSRLCKSSLEQFSIFGYFTAAY